MNSEYCRIFGSKIILSTELRKKEVYDKLVGQGYCWVRQRYQKHYIDILRFPTIGRWLEISKTYDLRCVPIDSYKGRKLINSYCFF